jgi:hypothetical protein
MAEYLRVGTSWLNVDKIIRVDNHGTPADPQLTAYFIGGDKVSLQGDDAKSLQTYLNGNAAAVKSIKRS